jgi:dTDP-4-dehydrorhamnose reductase
MPRILITGGTGYLGSELIRLAATQPTWQIVATSRTPPKSSPVRFVALDIRDATAVSAVLRAEQPEIVIHTAYVQQGPELWETTADGSGHVAQATAAVGAHLIHMSSDAIFDGDTVGRLTDAASASPITAYGQAKAEAERLVIEHCPTALLVRTSLIYGGTSLSNHERTILEAASGRKNFSFFADEIRNPIQVTDLASALLELATTRSTGVLNVAGTDAISRYTFACLVAAYYDYPHTLLLPALSSTNPTRRPRNCALDSRKAQTVLQTQLRGAYEVLEVPGNNLG